MMADKRPANWSDLASRVLSGALMAAAALAGAWFGGWVLRSKSGQRIGRKTNSA